jgi:RNase P subunit RPR2
MEFAPKPHAAKLGPYRPTQRNAVAMSRFESALIAKPRGGKTIIREPAPCLLSAAQLEAVSEVSMLAASKNTQAIDTQGNAQLRMRVDPRMRAQMRNACPHCHVTVPLANIRFVRNGKGRITDTVITCPDCT